MRDNFHVVIVGGGYAGVMCALRLGGRSRGRLSIALVNPRAEFVERLRLHEDLVEQPAHKMRSFDFAAFLGVRNVRFVEGSVVGLSRSNNSVSARSATGEELTLGYDRLVIASGSSAARNLIAGQADHCFNMDQSDPHGVARLRARLAVTSSPQISIIGGGATGIEVAAELSRLPHANVTLICAGQFGDAFTKSVARRLRKVLDRRRVAILDNCPVRSVASDHVVTSTGSISHDIVVACTGFQVSPVWRDAGLRTEPNGRVVGDKFLRSVSDPAIFLAGDAATADLRHSAPPRMSVMFAMTSGAHVAECLIDERSGRGLRRFAFWTYGQAIGLGNEAFGFGNMAYDKAYPPYFTGRIGFQLRHFFVATLFRLLQWERHLPGLPFYLGRPLLRDRRVLSRPLAERLNE